MRKGRWRRGLLCGTLAAMMSLGACAKEDDTKTTAASAEATTSAEATQEQTKAPETSAAVTTEAPTEAPTAAPTTEPTAAKEVMTFSLEAVPNAPNCFRTELDGVPEHVFVTSEYCFAESGKYVLCMDKGLAIPGDFAKNLDMIIEEIERQIGVGFQPDPSKSDVVDMSFFYNDFNPWEGLDLGGRFPIFLMTERYGERIVSGSTENSSMLGIAELSSDESWDAFVKASIEMDGEVPTRKDHLDYFEPAHELTHVLSLQYCPQSTIFSEGLAVVYESLVIDALAERSPAFVETKLKYKKPVFSVGEAVNADNAERIFCSDYSQNDFEHRLAPYGYGMALCTYLRQNYGDGFFKQFADVVNADPAIDRDEFYPLSARFDNIMEHYAADLKTAFGEDIFTKFGTWCVENGMIQE